MSEGFIICMMSLGIYVHIPFCRSKCGYCDFSSFAGMESLIGSYLRALAKEIKSFELFDELREVDSIFIGGGTPSLLSGSELKELTSGIKEKFMVSPDAEVSIEVNPSSAGRSYMEQLIEAGINRVSIGVQSFQSKTLDKLWRQARHDDAAATVKSAKIAGFKNISVDLMFGVPEQTLYDVEKELEIAISISPEHISAYQLTLAEGTTLFEKVKKGAEILPDEKLLLQMSQKVSDSLLSGGYRHYEISNFAKQGMECRHNLHYWRGGEFIGFGAGAHSFYKGRRLYNDGGVKKFIENSNSNLPVFEEIEEDENQRLVDYLLMRFRLIDEVIDFSVINQRFNIDFLKLYLKEITKLESFGLLKLSDSGICLTRKGLSLLNNVLLEFVKVR